MYVHMCVCMCMYVRIYIRMYVGGENGIINYVEHLSSELKVALKEDDVTEITSALYRLTAVMVSKKGTSQQHLYTCIT